ncbi:GAF and ANTAR domain-containing protein [Streptomyces glomeratus]|uniref:GAF and ANTAR domain-containing protein n=1 Tax=Streptomyces glomeratus TaxID=284452 RepID=A0ABP6LV43_9ACTN|nr:GAF and ANTAR domain-containing protein [Streptomyces glomeratus]MCF1507632.1 GAF and ANTAR domain-containing protein [Streptomyces glomeratus]
MRPQEADGHRVVPVVDWLLETASLRDFLQHLVDDAVRAVPGADGCGVTLQRRHRPLTVVSTGGMADKLDEWQYGQGDGPCLQAMRTGEIVQAADLLAEGRWGSYPSLAISLGVRSSLSLPIPVRAHTAGALNFYGAGPRAFSHRDERVLARFAAQAGGGIALAQRLADAEDFTRDLQAALRSRAVIDQAIGAIMQQRRCSADQAFTVLRTLSQHTNSKLREICARLLTDLGGQPPQQQPPLRPRP